MIFKLSALPLALGYIPNRFLDKIFLGPLSSYSEMMRESSFRNFGMIAPGLQICGLPQRLYPTWILLMLTLTSADLRPA